jgi:hypothetical protein
MRRTDVADRYLGPMFRVVVIRTKKRKQSTDGDVEERGEHMQQEKTCIVETCKAQKAFLTMFRGWFEKLFFYGLMGLKKMMQREHYQKRATKKKSDNPVLQLHGMPCWKQRYLLSRNHVGSPGHGVRDGESAPDALQDFRFISVK